MGKYVKLFVGSLIVGISLAVILIVALLPPSYSHVEYYQYGFKKRKSTGSIYRDKVYDSGRYALGPDFTFLRFDRYAQHESLKVTIFDNEKLEITINAKFQYVLRKDLLSNLHLKFGTNYESLVRKNAINSIKNTAPQYKLREFILNREEVEQKLFVALRDYLNGVCCSKPSAECDNECKPGCKKYETCSEDDHGSYVEVVYFQLLDVEPPQARQEKKLASLVLPEQNQAEIIKQSAKQIRLDTEKLVNDISNEANELRRNASASADYIKVKSEAQASSLVEKAKYSGLKLFYDTVGIDQSKHKIAFDYLRTMQQSNKTKIKVNFQQLMAVFSEVNKKK